MSRRDTWFEANVKRALDDGVLRTAVATAAKAKIAARAAAVAEVRNFEALRDLATRIKQHTVDHLDRYVPRFIERVEALGGKVHVVATPADANECIVRIARDNGLTLCAKVKSMTTEETGLVAAMEAAGVRMVETDLGEFIVQIDHDRPSHIVTPIIHKNRKTIAEAFARKLGVEYTEDPQALTTHARRYLRDVFRRCDLGVSGVNFAVAETGAICICTNEGNGRLSTTRPRVHVALMGREKVIPRTADLAVFLKVLARSSTGQPITVYTSLIHGPRRPEDPDGPEQLHVVILDGGRRRIESGQYRDVLRCVRCGACLNACPVYRRIGGHAYDNVYPGPIGKLLAPLLNDFEHYADLPQASSLCGRCLEVCPVRIDIPDLLVRMRRDQVDRKTAPWARRIAFRMVSEMLSKPWSYQFGQKLARAFSGLGADGDWTANLPGPFSRLTRLRDLPRPAARPFRQVWQEEEALQTERAGVPAESDAAEGTGISPHRRVDRVKEKPDADSRTVTTTEARPSPLPRVDPAVVRQTAPDDDLVSVFCARAGALGLHVTHSSTDTLARDVAALVQKVAAGSEAGPVDVIIEPSLVCRRDVERLLGNGTELLDPHAGDEAMFSAHVGVTGVYAAVAETGSLVCVSGPERWRGLSLIPPVHIAVVWQEQIVPDLVDLFTARLPTDLPANLTLISGPSKTADIEGILITGVHGPGSVHVVVVRGPRS